MSSLDSIRRKQIAEVIDADKNISRQVFQNTFKAVKQFQDTLKQPNTLEKKTAYELEKYIIEMESMLTEIEQELEKELAPYEQKRLEQIGEPDVIDEADKGEEEKEEDTEEKEEAEEGSGKKMRGGAKEVKISLLEIWNKFVNYVSKLANIQQFSQNDINVLYDRLDDIIPLLQSIQRLNYDAEKVGVSPIAPDVIGILLNKIQYREISPIIPAKELPAYSAASLKLFTTELAKLKAIRPSLISEVAYLRERRLIDTLRTKTKSKTELQKYDDRLKIIKEKWEHTQDFESKYGISPEDIDRRIRELEGNLRRGKQSSGTVKASKQALKGEGKTASSQILKKFGEEVYKVYESIPNISYDELENLYIDLQDRLKFAQEHDDKDNWEKYNFLISAILKDERAKDIQRMLGNGRQTATDYKFGRTSMPLPFRDADNEMYSY